MNKLWAIANKLTLYWPNFVVFSFVFGLFIAIKHFLAVTPKHTFNRVCRNTINSKKRIDENIIAAHFYFTIIKGQPVRAYVSCLSFKISQIKA